MDRKFFLLSGFFITCLLVSNIIAVKLVSIGGLIFPAAVILFPFTFLITDTVSEVWGRKRAAELVWLGFIMSVVMVVFLQLSRFLPGAHIWEGQEAFDAVLGAVPRIVVASMAAYLVSQLHDIWSFHFWRRVTGGKHLWLRNNLSTMSSQLLDSAVFISLAFAGIVPGAGLLVMIFSQYLVKLVIAMLDTPLCYLLVKWARGKKEGEFENG